MHAAGESLPAEMTVRDAVERVRASAIRTWLVEDRRGVIGVINLARLESESAEAADKKIGELMDAMISRTSTPTRDWIWHSTHGHKPD